MSIRFFLMRWSTKILLWLGRRKGLFALFLIPCFMISLATAGFALNSGDFSDFPFATESTSGGTNVITDSYLHGTALVYGSGLVVVGFVFLLPYDVTYGQFDLSAFHFLPSASSSGYSDFKIRQLRVDFYDVDGNLLDSFTDASSFGPFDPGARYIRLGITGTTSSGVQGGVLSFSTPSYSDFSYDYGSGGSSGGGSGSGLSDADLSIVSHILNSTYTYTSGITDSNGNITVTLDTTALEGLLNILGYSSSESLLLLTKIYNNWGNNFDYFMSQELNPSTGVYGQSSSVSSLPQYLSTVGNQLTHDVALLRARQVTQTDLLNSISGDVTQLQTDISTAQNAIVAAVNTQGGNITSAVNANGLLDRQQLDDALYTDKDSSNTHWSVAKWLKDIWSSLTSFFTNFWSPGETAIKQASEDAYLETADSGLLVSGENVSDYASFGGSVGGLLDSGVGPDVILDSVNQTWSNEFWSTYTQNNMDTTGSGSRGLLRSAPQSETPALDQNNAWFESIVGGGR